MHTILDFLSPLFFIAIGWYLTDFRDFIRAFVTKNFPRVIQKIVQVGTFIKFWFYNYILPNRIGIARFCLMAFYVGFIFIMPTIFTVVSVQSVYDMPIPAISSLVHKEAVMAYIMGAGDAVLFFVFGGVIAWPVVKYHMTIIRDGWKVGDAK